MKTKSKKGITLVELMAAVATGAFLILAAGIVMAMGQKSWNDAWKKVCIQREVSNVMLEITQPLKAAMNAYIDEPNSKSIEIYSGGDKILFSQVPGQNLLQKKTNGNPYTSITDKVQSLTFNVVGGKVIINLTLQTDGIQASSVSTIMMRNYGG